MMRERGEKRRESGRVPYLPPPPGGQERFRRVFRRYAFAAACVLFFAFFCTSLWLLPSYLASKGAQATAHFGQQDAPREAAYAEAGTRPADSPASAGTTTLSVTTRPAGASISVGMAPVGTTPLYGHELSTGAYVLSIEKEGYVPVDTVMLLDGERPTRLTLALTARRAGDLPRPVASPTSLSSSPEAHAAAPSARPEASTRSSAPERATPARGILRLVSHPAGASVQINGRSVGETPVRIVDVPAGTHTVTLHARGHLPLEREVTVQPAEMRTIEERLSPRTGTLSIRVRPWGTIYIDGTLRRSETDIRYRTTLPVGSHELTVVHPELGTWEKTVHVGAEETASVTVDFNNIAAPENLASRADGASSGW